ncbi:MAG: rhodanese-like domain-containing protein [Myxococcales bacterium]|nr:rhodanese-like domain-containing protein [Myxococcales bacterium]MCB9519512.1 rhodanese-like domain-containing protein [Myxococcales bacterium]MCB9533263.1 rhodanese-like domain-containing protein [Myxococcales bacterium]
MTTRLRILPLSLLLFGASHAMADDTAPSDGSGVAEGSAADSPEGAATDAPAEHVIAHVGVDEVSDGLHSGELLAVDVNTGNTRARLGWIPGAILLSDAEFAAEELAGVETSKGLVFYCYNQSCLASDRAATVALERGYTDVAVLQPGIQGWISAGNSTEGQQPPEPPPVAPPAH